MAERSPKTRAAVVLPLFSCWEAAVWYRSPRLQKSILLLSRIGASTSTAENSSPVTVITGACGSSSREYCRSVSIWCPGVRSFGNYSLVRVSPEDNSTRKIGRLRRLTTIASALSNALTWANFIRTGTTLDADFDRLLA